MKSRRHLLSLSSLLICSVVWTGTSSVLAQPLAYGSKVTFTEGHTMHFPDFELTYIGKRHVTPSQYPRGWWIYDFKVQAGNETQTISWSAGTGDIAPALFKVKQAAFQLELQR